MNNKKIQKKNNKLKVGIIFGGNSSESEVSLTGGRNVYNNLDRALFEPIAIYWDKNFSFWKLSEILVIRNTTKEIEERLVSKAQKIRYEDLTKEIDLAFLVTHGKFGDDGCIQGLLELLKIPYTGSGVLGAALGMNKVMQRKLLKSSKKINIPPYLTVSKNVWNNSKQSVAKNIEKRFSLPFVIKPSREGSTIGVRMIKKLDKADADFKASFKHDNVLIVEPYLIGREFSCIVIGNDNEIEALLPTETIHHGEIFTYDEKYLPGAANKVTPMNIDQKIIKEIQEQSILTYKILGCKDYARIDGFVLKDDNRVLITDPNSAASTGLCPSSWTWHQAAAAGYSVREFITKLINFAKNSRNSKDLIYIPEE